MITSRAFALSGAALAAAFVVATSSTGFAADLGYSVKDIPPPAPSGRAWYLKGTIGAGNPFVDSIWDEKYDTNDFTVHHKDMKSAPFYAVGIGIEHNRWLRFDVTGEYRGKWLFVGQDSYPALGAVPAGANEYTADITSWVGLFNAYIDLGTWRGVTPYVGAGIGVASLSVEGLRDTNPPNSITAYGKDHTETNFAWAIYGGVSYDVTPQFTMDLGYRYLDLGDARSGAVYNSSGAYEYSGLELRDVTSHDLMLTARYRLNQPSYVPVSFK